MKKLAACLMAMVMLWVPLCAMAASASQTVIALETDGDHLAPMLSALLGLDDAKTAQAVAAWLSGMQVRVIRQENGWSFQLMMEEEILNVAWQKDAAGQCVMQCSMIPGYAMIWPDVLQEADPSAYEEAAETIAGMAEVILSEGDWTVTYGSFIGDAYEGGTKRMTIQFDDSDLSLLLENIYLVGQACGIYDETMVAALCAVLESTAQANVYRYQLSIVCDEQDQVIGVSGTALKGDVQIATLSIGLKDNEITAIWGYGTGGVNYYICADVQMEATESTLNISGMLGVLADPAGAGFALISLFEDMLLEEHDFLLSLTADAEGTVYDGAIRSVISGADAYQTLLTFSGQAGDMTATLYWGEESDEPALLLHAATDPCEPVMLDTSLDTLVDAENLSDTDVALMNAAFNDELIAVMLKVFKQLPAEMLYLLMQ